MSFYFAWVDKTDTTWDVAYEREDEAVFAFAVEQTEGDFASLTVDIQNPREGFLATGRKQWAWLGYDDGGGAVGLFFGRLIAAPERLAGEETRLTFLARPADYQTQKEALAETLRVLPYFDPVWMSPDTRDDADAVLQGYSKIWHIDRTTHAVTVSDIVTGEDGTVDIAGGFMRDSLDARHVDTPLLKVNVVADVTWEQVGSGSIDITRRIADAFKAEGTDRVNTASTYTGEGLLRDWPATGDDFGGGWSVGRTRPRRLDGDVFPVIGTYANVLGSQKIWFPRWYIDPDMAVRFDATRTRRELMSFSLSADIQAVIAEAGEDFEETITLKTSAVTEMIDGARAIGPTARGFFQTARGIESAEYLGHLARTMLLSRARCIEITVDIPFDDAIALTCRKSLTVADDRLPGGTATGKIVGYRFEMSGDTGVKIGRVTIAVVPGNGGTLSATGLAGGYVSTGYVASGYQADVSGDYEAGTGDFAITAYGDVAIEDDGIDLDNVRAGDVVEGVTVTNGATDQWYVLMEFNESIQEAMNRLNAVHTTIAVQLKPLDGLSFQTDFDLSTIDLVVPAGIDLEAS